MPQNRPLIYGTKQKIECRSMSLGNRSMYCQLVCPSLQQRLQKRPYCLLLDSLPHMHRKTPVAKKDMTSPYMYSRRGHLGEPLCAADNLQTARQSLMEKQASVLQSVKNTSQLGKVPTPSHPTQPISIPSSPKLPQFRHKEGEASFSKWHSKPPDQEGKHRPRSQQK